VSLTRTEVEAFKAIHEDYWVEWLDERRAGYEGVAVNLIKKNPCGEECPHFYAARTYEPGEELAAREWCVRLALSAAL